jgi:hypothetical protein
VLFRSVSLGMILCLWFLTCCSSLNEEADIVQGHITYQAHASRLGDTVTIPLTYRFVQICSIMQSFIAFFYNHWYETWDFHLGWIFRFTVFGDVTSCTPVGGYQYFRRPWCLHVQGLPWRWGWSGRSMKLTIHLHLVPFPRTPYWNGALAILNVTALHWDDNWFDPRRRCRLFCLRLSGLILMKP